MEGKKEGNREGSVVGNCAIKVIFEGGKISSMSGQASRHRRCVKSKSLTVGGSHSGWVEFFKSEEIYSFVSFLEIYKVLKEITSSKFLLWEKFIEFWKKIF